MNYDNTNYVFVNGYGLVPFRIKEKHPPPDFLLNEGVDPDGCTQYTGEIKLPEFVTAVDGGKWIAWDYFYTSDKIFDSVDSALKHIGQMVD